MIQLCDNGQWAWGGGSLLKHLVFLIEGPIIRIPEFKVVDVIKSTCD